MMENLKDWISNLEKREDAVFLKGATEEQISQFEEKHGFNLPEQYKKYLKYSDGGEVYLPAGIQLYGVAHKPVIDVDEDDRPSDDYVVIGALATGDPILCKKNEQMIAIYNHEDGIIEADEIYDDFISFLDDLNNLLGIEE
mgnify:CR=1 FL=1